MAFAAVGSPAAGLDLVPALDGHDVLLDSVPQGPAAAIVYVQGTNTLELEIDLSVTSDEALSPGAQIPFEARLIAFDGGGDTGEGFVLPVAQYDEGDLGAGPVTYTFDLSGTAFRDFARDQHAQGRTLRPRVVLDPAPPQYAETDTANNVVTAAVGFGVQPREGNVRPQVETGPDSAYLLGADDVSLRVRVAVEAEDPADPRLASGAAFDVEVAAYSGGTPAGPSFAVAAGQVHPAAEITAISAGAPSFTAYEYDLSGAGFVAWAEGELAQGRTLRPRVTVDPADAIAEDDEGDNGADAASDQGLVPLSGVLLFGPVATTLGGVQPFVGQAPCAAGEVEVVSASWTPAAGPEWSAVGFGAVELASPCAALVPNGTVFDLAATANGVLGPVSGAVGEFGLTLSEVTLDVGQGALLTGTAQMSLPDGVTAHGTGPDGRPEARGTRTMSVSIAAGPYVDLGSLHATAPLSGSTRFLHAGALPFFVELGTQIQIPSSGGATGTHVGLRYVYDLPFDADDSRSPTREGVRSNDRRFGRYAAAQSDAGFVLDASGLDLVVDFAGLPASAPPAGTHYPRLDMRWGPYQLDVSDGRLVDAQALPSAGASYTFEQTTDCRLCAGGDPSPPAYAWTPPEDEGVASDGAVVSRVSALGDDPRWGRWDGAPTRNRFVRPDGSAQAGVLLVPGHAASGTGGTADVPVSHYLLGAREVTVGADPPLAPGAHHPLDGVDSRRGNFFRAGVTVGPEVYSDPSSGLPVAGLGALLDGTVQELRVGEAANPVVPLVGSAGTKYVLREGGVTGVFNFDLAGPLALTVYGYALELRSFAFRQVANEIDGTSWIDGSLDVPAPGGFSVAFSSLGIACTGDLLAGLVQREACNGLDDDGDGLVDENCDETLGIWDADIALASLAFVPAVQGAPVCEATTRVLEVGMSADVLALNDPLGLLARWLPSGHPEDARVRGRTDQVVDERMGAGFDVALDRGFTLASDTTAQKGWFEVVGTLGVPFWEAMDVAGRLENQTPAAQEQTLLVRRGTASRLAVTGASNADPATRSVALDDEETHPRAEYAWGSTGFGIGFPVVFEPGNHAAGEPPRFLGQREEVDLVVLNLGGGVDYVTPERTKVSFGASADFDKLQLSPIDLHIDIADPASLMKIDQFLATLGIGGDPLSTALGPLVEGLRSLNEIAESGFDPLLEILVRGAIEGANSAAGDPLQEMSDALGRVQSIPEVVTSELSGEVLGLVDRIAAPLTAELDMVVAQLYAQVPALIVSAKLDPAGSQAALLQQAGRVSDVRDALGRIDGVLADTGNTLVDVRESVEDLRMQAESGWIADAQAALDDVTSLLLTGIDMTSCDGPVASNVQDLADAASGLQAALQGLEIGALSSSLGKAAGVDASELGAAERDISASASRLGSKLGSAIQGVQAQATCPYPGSRQVELMSKIRQLQSVLYDAMSSVTTAVDAISFELLESGGQGRIGDLLDTLGALRGSVSRVDDLLARLERTLRRLADGEVLFLAELDTAAEIGTALDAEVLEVTGQGWEGPGGTFAEQLVADLRAPLEAGVAAAASAASDAIGSLTSKVPHPSPEELVDTIVDLVMNTGFVEEIDTLLDEQFGDVVDDLNALALDAADQVNRLIAKVAGKAEEKVNEAIAEASAAVEDLPVKAAELDGYAVIRGQELETLHVGAEWTMRGASDDEKASATSFNAALDVTRWTANGKGSCENPSLDASALLDAIVSTRDLKLKLSKGEVLARRIYLGFTLESQGGTISPKGLFGGITTEGTLEFEAFELYDIGFATGIGSIETYLGATAGGRFSKLQVEAAFLIGKTCDLTVLNELDPEVGDFIQLPPAPNDLFHGGYVRGAASIPIVDGGCLLRVGASAKVGAWVLAGPPATVGGLLGGGAYGKVACLVALRGDVTLLGQKAGGRFSFRGDAFGIAGVGFCEPEEWTTVAISRTDKLCGTFDATFQATYRDGWSVAPPKPSGPH